MIRKTNKLGLGIEVWNQSFSLYWVWKMPNPDKVLFLFGVGLGDKGITSLAFRQKIFYMHLYVYRKIFNLMLPLEKKKMLRW